MRDRFWLSIAAGGLLVVAACDQNAPNQMDLPTDPSPLTTDESLACPVEGFCADITNYKPLFSAAAGANAALATAWVATDIFAGVNGGNYDVYDNTGVFKEQINDGLSPGFTTGCAFNPTLDKLYTTSFSRRTVVVYDDPDPHAVLQTIVDPDGGANESVVFAANGDFFVGHPSIATIHHYDATGTLITTYSVASSDGTRGTDWVDLAANQTTLFYDAEGRVIRRYDIVAGQLADFATLPGSGNAFALRLLPPGDGTGGLLVADGAEVKRVDGSGTTVQTYDVTGENSWFSLNLDPNGTSFWAGNFSGNRFYRFDIASGALEVGPITTGGTLFGLCLKGEPTAGGGGDDDERRMTGGGSFFSDGGARVTHGFELRCDVNAGTSNLQINWPKSSGKGSNRFHLESLDSASCSDDANFDEGKPIAGFDTFTGSGTGRLNGQSGHTITFTFTDTGEPGKGGDLASIDIDGGAVVVSNTLRNGNHQAHGN